MAALIDSSGRRIRKLRVSLTDACNYRCTYCMPEKPVFTPVPLLLRPEEYGSICSALVALGIEELRVTGGEPTIRPGFRKILEAMAGIPARKRGITSNGHFLARHLDFLWETGWRHLNISVDSLDPGKFERITGGGDLRIVVHAVEKAAAMGFVVKTNAVIMRGVNDDELSEFASWSAESGVEVRFLELMRVGPGFADQWRRFLPADEMIARLVSKFRLSPLEADPDSTALLYRTDLGARLGFIASESKPFCGTCSRLRLTATGALRACLMHPAGISLRHARPEDIPGMVERVMGMKPTGRIDHVEEPMHAVGG